MTMKYSEFCPQGDQMDAVNTKDGVIIKGGRCDDNKHSST